MQLTCPNCEKTVRAENINIQQMVAVCGTCDTVFDFTHPNAQSIPPKLKKRKVKPPAPMIVDERDDSLELAFRTNFRLDRDESFITGIILSGLGFFGSIATINEFLYDTRTIFPLVFVLVTLALIYRLILHVYNRTHIYMDMDTITISRQPLPQFFDTSKTVNVSGITAIRCEETKVSKRENYDTPRYQVWGETIDGLRRVIVTDVTEPYAYYITQALNERLESLSVFDDDAHAPVINETIDPYANDAEDTIESPQPAPEIKSQR